MTEPVTADFYIGDHLIDEHTYTIQDYAELVFDKMPNDTALVELMTAMVKYGGYSQAWFENYNAASYGYAYDILDDISLDDVPELTANYNYSELVAALNDMGLEYAGLSLTLDSNTTLNIYVKGVTGDTPVPTVDGEETPFEYDSKVGAYVIRITDITSRQVDSVFEVTIGDYTFNVGPQDYIRLVLNNSSSQPEALVNLVKAYYWYGEKADVYFPTADND